MQFEPHEIHIWSSELILTPEQESENLLLLSPDERARALRFQFAVHTTRFIATHSLLRRILSIYLSVSPKMISFDYTQHQKPYLLQPNDTRLQFNLSHSNNMGIFAFTMDHAIGVDIEKIENVFKEAVAERFFSAKENLELMQLPVEDKIQGFYRIWSRKEALIKAVGKGLTIPLTSFSVSTKDVPEMIQLEDENWQLIPLSIHPNFKSAVASNQLIKKISYWTMIGQSPKLTNVENY